MSANPTTLVPILDRTNWEVWSKVMKAFLMSIGLWKHADGTVPWPSTLGPNPTAEAQDAHDLHVAALEREENQCIGNIVLHCSAAIQQEVSGLDDASTLWNCLQTLYGEATLTGIYKDFKEALSANINPEQHPGPTIDKCQAAFQHLRAASLPIPDVIAALILLHHLPAYWQMLSSIVTQSYHIGNLTFKEVCDAMIAQ